MFTLDIQKYFQRDEGHGDSLAIKGIKWAKKCYVRVLFITYSQGKKNLFFGLPPGMTSWAILIFEVFVLPTLKQKSFKNCTCYLA